MTGTAKYREGDWFIVPLCDGSYAVMLIARRSRSKITLGYFFGPATQELPTLRNVVGLRAGDAVLVCLFGALGISDGVWIPLGRLETWNRDDWPMPVFVQKNPLTENQYFLRFYDPDDPGKPAGETVVRSEVVPDGPEDGLFGYVAAQIVLSQRLGVA